MTAMSERLLAEEAEPAQTLVVMEATGNFWMRLAWHLHRQGFAVSVINPAQAALLQSGKRCDKAEG
jgi:transposase